MELIGRGIRKLEKEMKNKNHYVLFSYSDCLHVLTLIAYSISQKTSYCKDPPKLSTYTCSLNMWKSTSALTVNRRLLHNTEVWLVFKNYRYNSSYSYLSTVDAEKIVLIHNRLAI
jgi:hypothetical protein